jgi:hypothetical protein
LNNSRRRAAILLVTTLALLILIYLPTLLTQINGGEYPFSQHAKDAQTTA